MVPRGLTDFGVSLDVSNSSTIGLTFVVVSEISLLLRTDIHFILRMQWNKFGDPLTFHLALSSGSILCF